MTIKKSSLLAKYQASSGHEIELSISQDESRKGMDDTNSSTPTKTQKVFQPFYVLPNT
jgi:hypothetical protein